MKSNIIALNPMDSHFFGKPLLQWASERTDMSTKATKFVESSVDDFNRYFDFMTNAFKKPLERMPKNDVYVPRQVVKSSNIDDSFGPSF